MTRAQFVALVGAERAAELLGEPCKLSRKPTRPAPAQPTTLEVRAVSSDNRHELTVFGWTPATLNSLTKSNHWSGRARLKKADRDVIGFAQHCVKLPEATGKRRVSLQVIYPTSHLGKLPDTDAFWKTTLDALVHAKLLVDDGPRWTQLGSVDIDRQDTPATKIILEEIPA